MLDMFVTESIFCQWLSLPFLTAGCTWQQMVPAPIGYLAAFALRARGVGRLFSFVGGVAVFYLITALSAMSTTLQARDGQFSWFLYAGLFLVPTALVLSLFGLLCGDFFRFCKKQWRLN